MKTINIYGEIGFQTRAEEVVAQFMDAAGAEEPVTLAIASEGGSVFDGLAMAAAIRSHPAPVHAEVQGYALSMAANLALECDTVSTYEDSFLMFHEVHGGAGGSQKDHENAAAVMDKMNDHTARRLAKATGAEKEQMREALAGTLWMDGKEAFQAGIVTEVRPALALAAKFGIDDPEQFCQMMVMTDKIRDLLGLKKEEQPPPAELEALHKEVADYKAEVQLQHDAIAFAREHIAKLEAKLEAAREEAQADAYRKLAAAGHERLNVSSEDKDKISLAEKYEALSADVRLGVKGAAAKRKEFRQLHRRQLEQLS